MPASKALTPRKFLVYVGVLAIVALADPRLESFIAGGVLAFFGILLRVWGCGHLEKNQKVVTTGPYAHVKNPLYVGTFLASFGGLLAAGSWSGRGLIIWAGLAPLFAIVFFLFYMPRKKSTEGDRLARKFGEEFERYNAAVPDFVPQIKPYRSGDPQRWSFKRFVSNNEFGMDILIVLLFAAIWYLPPLIWKS